jgi:hypothetical protein
MPRRRIFAYGQIGGGVKGGEANGNAPDAEPPPGARGLEDGIGTPLQRPGRPTRSAPQGNRLAKSKAVYLTQTAQSQRLEIALDHFQGWQPLLEVLLGKAL